MVQKGQDMQKGRYTWVESSGSLIKGKIFKEETLCDFHLNCHLQMRKKKKKNSPQCTFSPNLFGLQECTQGSPCEVFIQRVCV